MQKTTDENASSAPLSEARSSTATPACPITPSAQMAYLIAAINDTQSTIRALDTKLGILMTIFVIPFTKLGAIISKCSSVFTSTTDWSSTAFTLLVIGFAGSWLFGFVAAYRGLVGIENPVERIKVADKNNVPKGTFFRGGLFDKPCICHAVDNFCGESKLTLEEQFAQIPSTLDEIHKELVYEQSKLTYIRHVKMHRMQWAFRSGFAWIATGGIIWIIFLSLKS